MNKNQKTWLIVGVVTAFVLVICCACGIGGYVWWSQSSAERAAENYLEAIKDRDIEEVRELTCLAKRDDVDPLDSDEELVSWEILNTEQRDTVAEVRARVEVREDGEPDTETIDIELVKEDGDWLVCDIRVI